MAAQHLACYHVDAFALPPSAAPGAAFTGNPAAVVLCPTPLPDATCRALAAEFNLSETAFVTPALDAAGGGGSPFASGAAFHLRWFTPVTEVALCGHATLAAAHVLTAEAGNTAPALTFATLSGPLVVTPAAAAARQHEPPAPPRLAMRFPYNAPAAVWEAASGAPLAALPRPLLALLAHALAPVVTPASLDGDGNASVAAVASQLTALLHSVHYSAGTRKLVVRLADARAGDLAALAPDARALGAVDQRAAEAALRGAGGEYARTSAGLPPVTGVSVTVAAPPAPAPEGADGSELPPPPPLFWSRYFTPWNGIPEDPVNGSSHTILAPYWARQAGLLKAAAPIDDGTAAPPALPPGHAAATATLSALQLSTRRGLLGLRVDEVADGAGAVVPGLSSVTLEGACVTVYRGTLRL
jgi:predicted PhzF superfamily epimerase YddE/YHI9